MCVVSALLLSFIKLVKALHEDRCIVLENAPSWRYGFPCNYWIPRRQVKQVVAEASG